MVNSKINKHLAAKTNNQIMIRNKISSVSPGSLSDHYGTQVNAAYRNRHIFTVFGNFKVIREALLKRDWLEKLPPGRYNKLQALPQDVLLRQAKPGNEYETAAISRVVNNFPAFFIWQEKDQQDLYPDVNPYRNRIRINYQLDFSSKVGLIACAEQQQWFSREGLAIMTYPRFFRLGPNEEERSVFIDEYRITQCCCLLRYLKRFFEMPKELVDYQCGTVCSSIVDFALARILRRLEEWDEYSLLDVEPVQIDEDEWKSFLDNCSRIIYDREKIKCTNQELSEFLKKSKDLLTKLEEKYPDLKWDGYKNWWILKPGYMNRGQGIVIRSKLNEILKFCTDNANGYYIAQKYIEHPLLIYRTKFDIRQYMLIAVRESTVQIWIYKECYFRFSSQEYNTDSFNESIHLTNNCVQIKYQNKPNRDARLPKNNMWTLQQFKEYLRLQNMPEGFWENHIFAGFKANIVAAVLPSLDEANLVSNSFELYGCDFMLDENYSAILIEINFTPDLSASTEITGRICPMVQQDLVKVIVDLPQNGQASTGLFELIYEVNYEYKNDVNNTDNLNVIGKSMKLYKMKPPIAAKKPKIPNKPPVLLKKH